MKKIFTIFLWLLVSQYAKAQTVLEKIEAAKIGIITQKINLTPRTIKEFLGYL